MNPLVRRGQITVDLFGGSATIEAGQRVEVARACCDSIVGATGLIHGWRHTSRGIRVIVDYGKNQGGQRLLKPYPANVLRVTPNTGVTGPKPAAGLGTVECRGSNRGAS